MLLADRQNRMHTGSGVVRRPLKGQVREARLTRPPLIATTWLEAQSCRGVMDSHGIGPIPNIAAFAKRHRHCQPARGRGVVS